MEELLEWALAFDDITLLPVIPDQVADLLPQTGGDDHSYERLPRLGPGNPL
jgi:hypothetical protein